MAWKNNRPENWTNPHIVTVYSEKVVDRSSTTTAVGGLKKDILPDPVFEAGADAMLKAIYEAINNPNGWLDFWKVLDDMRNNEQ